jgi:predicted nucleic acid-binding protein
MVTYYLDTSALLKRYVDEVGSDWLQRVLFAPAREIVIVATQLLVVEIISALNRRVREGTVTRHDCMRLSGRFRDDCLDSYQLVAPDDVIVDLACALLERHPLRAYDAMHLATALIINRWLVGRGEMSLTFLSADDRLNDAAAAEGLAVDNPNDHP